LPEDHKTRDRAGAVSPTVITKRILDEKSGLAQGQPKIEVVDSLQPLNTHFLDEKAL
jgi:hypothetical protein